MVNVGIYIPYMDPEKNSQEEQFQSPYLKKKVTTPPQKLNMGPEQLHQLPSQKQKSSSNPITFFIRENGGTPLDNQPQIMSIQD